MPQNIFFTIIENGPTGAVVGASPTATTLCDNSEANWNGRKGRQTDGQTDRQTGPRIESG